MRRGKFQNFQKSRGYPENCPNQTCGCWLITPNQQTLIIELIYLTESNYKSKSVLLQNSVQLQNNPLNAAMLITINRVISLIIFIYNILRLNKTNLRSIISLALATTVVFRFLFFY